MKRHFLASAIIAATALTSAAQDVQQPDTIWYKYADRFCDNTYIKVAGYDSIEFADNALRLWKLIAGIPFPSEKKYPSETGEYHLGDIERHLAKPGQYSGVDYTSPNSKWSFERSMESEHYVCFWEKGLTRSGNMVSGVNIKTLLNNAEKIWDVYVNQLGFLVPGHSITDRTKIHMYIVNQTDWRADGSGENGTEWYYSGTTKKSRTVSVPLFHCNPSAATARGGHTPAHEIGHTFQYLVSADLGNNHGFKYGFDANASEWSGNCWWEDCANWQAYKVYPERQFTDGEYFEQYMERHHQNIMHEASRYANCFYHDYWCMKHGMDVVGRVWRESIKPEDPMEAYMRIFNLSLDDFAAEMYDCFARMATWDIDGVRDRAKHRIGAHLQRLTEPSQTLVDAKLDGKNDYWWVVDADYCPQNYGYNINPLKVPEAGTEVRVTFRGIEGANGYRKVKTSEAGWRYGLVAYTSDGERIYSPMQSEAHDGTASLTVPQGCTNLWLVVMGAPKSYWRHEWDDNTINDEQWPYAVHIEGSNPLGANRTYGVFPEDYARHDTTVVINATLAYDASSYTSVRVQYDMDAISLALGISTAQLKAIKRNDTTSNPGDVRFAGVNANGTTMNFNTTTSTSSSTCYGHWFTTTGNVCGYDGSAAVFAELYPDKFGCYVGQYPGRLVRNHTYIIRQAVVYTHTDGQMYKAIMEVHLKVQ